MLHTQRQRFVRDLVALDEARLTVRLTPCPHCARTGLLIGNGILWGYAERDGSRVVRGRRFLCPRHARKAGCGRTFSIRLSEVIPRFVVRTATLSRLLLGIAEGLNRKTAWERAQPGLCLRSAYRLWARLVDCQTTLRTALCTRAPPPDFAHDLPVAQLAAHLLRIFDASACVLAEYQLTFQRSLLD